MFKNFTLAPLKAILFVLVMMCSAGLMAQTISTDQPDYGPGTTATFTGSGFLAGELISVVVHHADGTPDSGADHDPWTVTADASGGFETTWHVCEDDCVGSTLKVTAVGQTSGLQAQALFTDAPGTDPSPFSLSAGSFSFTGFASGSTTTYPASMQGWAFTGELTTATLTSEPAGDRVLLDNTTSITTGSIRNEAANGISLLNSGSNNIGAIVVALNASGRSNLLVTFTAQQLNSGGSGTGDRVNGLRLQYRLGTTGTFTDVPSTEYLTNTLTTQNTAATFTNVALPSAVDNQPVVQIRWVYYLSSGTLNSRDRIRLDDVTVSSSSPCQSSDAGSATYNSGWTNGLNDNPTGFGAWQLSPNPNNGSFAGFFTASSDINTGGRSWGTYANTSNTASAVRPFASPLSIGNTVSYSMDNGAIQNGGTVGMSLRNSTGNNLMEFFFSGGSSFYTINDNAGSVPTTVGFTGTGLDISIAYTASNTYSIAIKLRGSNTTTYFATRSFLTATGGPIPAQIRFFNFNAGNGGGGVNDQFFNSIALNNTVITNPPSTNTQTLCLNAAATQLSVTAFGAGTLNYQWFSNAANNNTSGSPISGANLSTYTPSTSSTGTLYYYCIVTGTCGSVTSNVSGAVTVNAAPVINTQPSTTAQTICTGGSFNSISVSASGSGLSYQWYSSSAPSTAIVGATNASYTPSNGVAGPVTYFCIVSVPGGCSVTSSNSGSFTVNAQPSMAGITGGTASCNTSISASLTAGAITGGNGSPAYQWQLWNDVTPAWNNISGATNASFATNVSSPSQYRLNVTFPAGSASASGCASITSNTQTVIPYPVPTASLTGSPASPVCSGTSVTLTASGAIGGLYEFFKNNVSVQGPASANTYIFTPLNNDAVNVKSTFPITYDGNINTPEWGSPIVSSTGGPATSGFGTNRLDALFVKGDGTKINFALAGNVDNNSGNKILVFIDSKSGGFTNLSSWTNRTNTPYKSMENLSSTISFDNGFAPDYILGINQFNGSVFYDLYDMQANINNGTPTVNNGFLSNTATGDFSKGYEFSINLSSLGSPVSGMQVFGMVVNQPNPTTDPTFISNQFLSHAGSGQANYGTSPNFNNEPPNPVVIPSAALSVGTCTATSTTITYTVNSFGGAVTLLNETVGTPAATTLVNSYTGWSSTSPITFSSTDGVTDVRTTTPSTGYTGASGNGNVFFGTSTTTNRNFNISGINTTGLTSPVLSFGLLRDNLTAGITLEVSADGTTYTPLTITQPATANAWTLVTATGTIPATANLRIRFSKNNSTSFRLDDINLSGSTTAASISQTNVCGTSATLTASQGSSYVWSTGATTQSITVNSQGSFSVTITDSKGCTSTASTTITFNALPTASITGNASFCAGGNTVLNSNATAGSGSISAYQWLLGGSNISGANSATYTATVAGSYTVTVTNSNGCSFTSSAFVVSVNPLPTATWSAAASSVCPSAASQSTTLAYSATSNSPTTYSITWNTSPSNTFAPVTDASLTPSSISITVPAGTASGTYTGSITVKNANGCVSTASSFTVTVNPAPPVTTGASICQGGSGTLSATGCAAFINAGTTISGSWTASTDPIAKRPTISILNSSTCSFDANNTRNYVASQFQVSVTGNYIFEMNNNAGYDGMGYIVTGAFTPGTCGSGTWIRGDDDDGVAADEPRLGASGIGAGLMNLTTGVTYTLISTTFGSTGTFSGSFAWTITPPSGGQVMLPTGDVLGWYTSLTGGSPIGTGSPFNPVGVTGSGLSNTNNAGTTTYYAACSSNSTCRSAVDFVINTSPQFSVSSTNVSCNGAANGTITLSGLSTGATTTIKKDGTGADLSAQATFAPGTYVITASLPNSSGTCTTAKSVTITEPITVTVSASKTNVSCNGLADGTITASASAGASITVNGNPYVASATYGPGTYTVVASAPNGNNNGSCTATTTVSITQPIQ